ncbi:MAG: RICIN domain-containing protein [Blastocatellia bacterium]
MKRTNFGICNTRNRRVSLVVLTMTLIVLAGGLIPVSAQLRNINQAKQRIRDRMIQEQAGRNPEVRFNNDEQFSAVSNSETRVQGSGTYHRDRNDSGRSFNYDAIFVIRGGALRTLNYNFTGGGDSGGGGGATINCASDDGRRKTCPADTSGGVRLARQISGSPCIQGQTWGFNRRNIWVDRGCRADFEVGSGGGPGPGPGGGDRPNGNVIHNGAITSRSSGRSLDVTERSMREGGNVQQWDYADQPNQNWEVIDMGQNVVAIIARHSGMALTVDGDRDRSNVVQRRWRGNTRQQWQLRPVGDGWYQLTNVGSGRCMDVEDKRTDNGANMQQYSCSGADNQQFRLGR